MKPVNRLARIVARDILPSVNVKLKMPDDTNTPASFWLVATNVKGSTLGPLMIKCLIAGLDGYKKSFGGLTAEWNSWWGGAVINGRAFDLKQIKDDRELDTALRPSKNTFSLNFKVKETTNG